ncbi:ATP-binding cassette domain-containing protein [Saxibacter everestensis]|uniref:ATP-binding cassette domain-containing protein n=1 Tax=Saxibacter everestensis TaxID=2909229 RepID=A0ABY8QS80_9MICO|nr:ATP-binding cassette domain-containing protein [Brevibacteriaceae bacterium ZFBP1038]
MNQPAALVQVDGLNLTIGERQLLHGVDFSVQPAEIVAIAGPSGSGKSLSLRAVLGLLPPHASASGRIWVSQDHTPGASSVPWSRADQPASPVDVLNATPAQLLELRRHQIGAVFQESRASLNPARTVGQHLTEITRESGMSRNDAEVKALGLLEEVGLDGAIMGRYPGTLSGGMAQRVAIAGALMGDPRLLIADEPMSALDVVTARVISDLLVRLCRTHGMAMLLVTHDARLARAISDRIYSIDVGRMHEAQFDESMVPREYLGRRQSSRSGMPVGSASTLDAGRSSAGSWPADRASGGAAGESSGESISESSIPGTLTHESSSVGGTSDTVLEVRGLSHRFGDRQVLRNVSFDIPRGAALGLIGVSGSGKTTLAGLLLGLERADSGRIDFHLPLDLERERAAGPGARPRRAMRLAHPGRGQRLAHPGRGQRLADARRAQLVWQDPDLALDSRTRIGADLVALLNLHDVADRAAGRPLDRAAELLATVGLSSSVLTAVPSQLSGGQRQRVVIAKALAIAPGLLILDEPTSQLDAEVADGIVELLNRLRVQRKLSLLVISHDFQIISALCGNDEDQVGVLDHGELVETGSTKSLLNSPQSAAGQALVAAAIWLADTPPIH